MQLTVCFVSSFVCLIQQSRQANPNFFCLAICFELNFSTIHWHWSTLQYNIHTKAVAIIIRIKYKNSMKKDHDQSTFFPFIVWILSFWLVVSVYDFSLHTYYSKKQDRIHSTTRIHFIKTIYEPSYNPLSFREKINEKDKIMCLGECKNNMVMTDWLIGWLTEWENLSCSKNRQD